MAKHQELTGPAAVHLFAFIGATDPSLDPENDVQYGKGWIDTSGGTGNWVLKIRNAANTAWETLNQT